MPSNPNNSNTKVCKGCLKPVVKAVSCDKCNWHYHPSCAQKANLLNALGELSCCVNINFNPGPSDLPAGVDIIATIKSLFAAEFANLKKSICDLYDEKFKTLKDDMAELSSRLSLIENSTRVNSADSASNSESLIFELAEREKRSKNVICYNVEEANDPDTASRIRHGRNLLTSAVNQMCDLDLTSAKILRLGPRKPGLQRPVKICLQSKQDAILLLKGSRLYKGSYRFSADITKSQREHYRSLKARLKTLHDNGDTSKAIKYANSIPYIISVKNKAATVHSTARPSKN